MLDLLLLECALAYVRLQEILYRHSSCANRRSISESESIVQ